MTLTCLESFIEQKKNAYETPSRRGGSKGEPIGFSRKKYLATLSMLTSDKQITVAMELGVSYGLLRKWNTEGPFREKVKRHCREFAESFVRRVIDGYAQREGTGKGYPDSGTVSADAGLFRDGKDYSAELMAEILRSAVIAAEKAEKENAFARGFAVLSAFLELVGPAIGRGELEKISARAGIDLGVLARGVKLGAIERVKDLVAKKGLEDAERTEAFYLLEQLKKTI